MNIAPGLQPRISFVPTILNALSSANQDNVTKAFAAKLGPPLVKQLLDNWKRMSGQEKARRYYLSQNSAVPAGDLATQLAVLSKSWLTARDQLIRARKKIIKVEVDRAFLEGVHRYVPSSSILKDKSLIYEILRKIYAKLNGCRCEEDNPSDPPVAKKFGVKVSKLKCHDQREVGNDEIYLVSAAVDGNGKLVTTTSSKYSIDDDDDDVRYPNYWVYPMQDPNGFLDVAISMWEDDGGYTQAGQAVAAIGSAVGTIPNPYTVGAGVALQIIGGLISLASWLDDDDHYGNAYRTWPSATNLAAGVGTYTLSYYEVDTGWFDDGHDLDVQIKLLTA